MLLNIIVEMVCVIHITLYKKNSESIILLKIL